MIVKGNFHNTYLKGIKKGSNNLLFLIAFTRCSMIKKTHTIFIVSLKN